MCKFLKNDKYCEMEGVICFVNEVVILANVITQIFLQKSYSIIKEKIFCLKKYLKSLTKRRKVVLTVLI